jgi:hypothetical protein
MSSHFQEIHVFATIEVRARWGSKVFNGGWGEQQLNRNRKKILMQVLCYHYHSTMHTHQFPLDVDASHVCTHSWDMRLKLMSNEFLCMIPN